MKDDPRLIDGQIKLLIDQIVANHKEAVEQIELAKLKMAALESFRSMYKNLTGKDSPAKSLLSQR